MAERLIPDTSEQVEQAVAWAASEEIPLQIVGHGSKRGFGRPVQAERDLDLSRLRGITLYEPEELVLSARAGTPLAEIQAALAERGQELAFEPPDLAPLYGGAAGAGSIGGLVACNLSGPRRIRAGAARDHFLGFSAVSGRGETFKSGGRVMKNVTGYDLSKLLAGSFGTLGVMTGVTVKVLPAAEKSRTVLVYGLDDEAGVKALSRGLGSPHEVSGAAHLPAAIAAGSAVDRVAGAGGAVTALRLEGPGPSVEHRCAELRRELAGAGQTEELHSRNSTILWQEIRDAAPFVQARDLALWRISVAPTTGPLVAAQIAASVEARYFFDWGGGLIWLALPAAGDAAASLVREVVAAVGGHATLMRGADDLRLSVPVFEPQEPAKAALSRRIKESFDPRRVLNPGRMYADV